MLPQALLAAIPASAVALSAAAMLIDSPGSAQVVIHERITIRVPRMAPLQRIVSPQSDWKEQKGPKCLGMGQMVAAAITAPAAVDLLLNDGRWMRAKLEGDCRSVDFYSGLYMRPGNDGQICAKREAIRIRSGAKCMIEAFRLLKARQ
jgi:hypothetical protein